MNLTWRDFDRAMPRRPDQPGDTDEPAGWPRSCHWCGDTPEAGEGLCVRCKRDLEHETKIYRGELP